MIELSNGHRFKYMVASGALGFDGQGWPWERPLVKMGLIKPELFTTVLKTLTLNPTKGYLNWLKPWECVRLIPGGSVNKIGLTNLGIIWWASNIAHTIDFEKFSIVASIFGTTEELVQMAMILNDFPLKGIEVNVSCPNKKHDEETLAIIAATKTVKRVSKHPIIIKVGAHQQCIIIAKSLTGYAEAMSWNSVPWAFLYPHEPSPLHSLEKRVGGGGGGVSGKPAQATNWHEMEKVSRLTDMKVIASSIMEKDDIRVARKIGADAVSFGAIHLRTPWKPTTIVKNL
jgi:dihydroorotate dehydrogenase